MVNLIRSKAGWLWLGAASCALTASPCLAQGVPQESRRQDPAVAQNDEDEIVVTATRREETLQRVPIAVTARTRDDLQERSVTRLTDITQSIPNVAFSTNNDLQSSAGFTIRGFTTTNNNTGVSPGVGIYIDGIYVARNAAFDAAVNDAARIEVLRGPQGTQFGRNAVHGAINIITLDPGSRLEGEAVLQLGSYDLFDARARISGPVGEGVGVLLSAYFRDRDGFVFNSAQNTTLNGEHYFGGRLKVLIQPSPDLDIRLTLDGQRDDTSANTQDFLPIDFIAQTNGVNNGGPETFERDILGVSGEVRYRFSDHELVSNTGYRFFEASFVNDQDFTTTRVVDFAGRDEETSTFSQELRLVSPADRRLNYIVGLYYLNQSGLTATRAGFGPAFPLANTQVRPVADLDLSSYAAFANVTFNINDSLRLIGGLRYTRDEQDFVFTQTSTVLPIIPNVPATIRSRTDDEWSPLLTLAWQATPDLLLYGTYSRGFKAGGYNTTIVFNTTQISTFEPETVTNYEIGVRSRLAPRVTLNVTAFYQDYTNQQISVFGGPVVGFLFQNAAASRSQGIEIELAAEPVRGLQLTAAAGYNDAEYDSFPSCSGTVNCSGNELPTPRFNASGSISYEQPLFRDASIRARIDGFYQDGFFTNDINTILATDRTIINGRVTFVLPGRHFEVSVFGTNIFDDEYVTPRNADFTPGRVTSLPTPAQFGVELRARF